jgi:hypothetical protein
MSSRIPDYSTLRRIAPGDYGCIFDTLWQKLKKRFFKLECEQFYNVPDDPCFRAYKAGDIDAAMRLFRVSLKEDYKYLDDITRKNLDYTRVHILERPFSEYILFELKTYEVSAHYGQRIFLIESQFARELNMQDKAEFMIFDSYAVVFLKYDSSGLREGIFLSEDSALIEHCNRLAEQLIVRSLSLGKFQDEQELG